MYYTFPLCLMFEDYNVYQIKVHDIRLYYPNKR